jgi:signal transduction histidine kinase
MFYFIIGPQPASIPCAGKSNLPERVTGKPCQSGSLHGYSSHSHVRTLLHLLAVAALILAGADTVRSAPLPPLVLTNAAQVLRLTAAQAAQSLPVFLRGVVVDESQPRERALILADASASLYLFADTNLFAPYHRRDLLVIKGVTSSGEFAPCVRTTTAERLGMGAAPRTRPVTYQQLITGALDAQYVEITGVVRQSSPAAPDSSTWRILLAADGGTVPVRIPIPRDPRIQEDAEVTIQAVCLYEFNQKRQALSPVLQVPRGVTVSIKKLAPSDPYAAPVRSAVSLLQYSPDIPYGHRVHVRGVVTRSQPGSLVWIRDQSSGLRIQIHQTDDLQPGDQIDALGFPGYGSSSPVLEDAIYQKISTQAPPPPLMLANPVDAYDHQDDLISMTATLTDIQPSLNGLVLTLEHNKSVFKAILRQTGNPKNPSGWQAGSLVRVTGICEVIYDDAKPVMGIWHPQSFQILMRSPDDLVILQTPPWWTPAHVMLVLGVFTSGLMVVSGTLLLLARRRLHEQTHRRAMAEAEFTAILSERNRLAREIHDTLAQGLTATSVQLQLARIHSPEVANSTNHHLDLAQKLVRESLEEARNSIWNMRPQVLETGNLADALKNILKQLSAGSAVETGFAVAGRERRLPAVIETNVLRLGQEAITNATNHAAAKCIQVRLEFGEKYFSLTVADDGRGFDADHPPASDGGFGLVGMRERAVELSGELLVRSAAGQGTEIALWLPLLGE